MKLIVYLCLLLTCMSSYAIVTIESLKMDGSDLGLKSNVSIDINGSSGNSDKSDGRVGADLVWRAPEYINYVLFSYEYGKANSETDTNNSFFHARHIRQYNTKFDLEYFVQAEKDEFSRLNSRNIVGGGARFPIPINGFFGIGAMYFEERLDALATTNESRKDEGVRLNSYLSGEYRYDDRTLFTARLYAQPRIDAFDDLRILFNASVKFAITPKASLRMGVKSSHDSKPPADVEKTNIAYTSGFEYSF